MKRLLLALALLSAFVPALAQNVNGKTAPFFQQPFPQWYGRWYEFQDPMEYTVTTNWAITTTGSTPTAVVTAAKSGSMVLTCTSSANDKVSITEKLANCKPAAGDSFGFQVRFTTDANVATGNMWFGMNDSSSNANVLTNTTGYVANGVGIRATGTTLELWTGRSASATADMTTYSLGTIANSTTYTYTVLVRCDPSTTGAGDIKVWRTTKGSNALGNQLILSRKATVDIPVTSSMYSSLGILAVSTASNVVTVDAYGWGANR